MVTIAMHHHDEDDVSLLNCGFAVSSAPRPRRQSVSVCCDCSGHHLQPVLWITDPAAD